MQNPKNEFYAIRYIYLLKDLYANEKIRLKKLLIKWA